MTPARPQEAVQALPRFQGCGERRAHPAHDFELPERQVRCPGCESVIDQFRAVDELVSRRLPRQRGIHLPDDD